MAGNMWEWTTGHNINSSENKMFVVPRGGGYAESGLDTPVVQANGYNSVSHYNLEVGFRVVLYIS